MTPQRAPTSVPLPPELETMLVEHLRSSWVVCGLEDGTSVQVTVKVGHEDAMMRALARLAPTATFGFSPELAARFKSAPASLRKSA